MREHVSPIGTECPGLWSVSILEHLFQDAPVLQQTRGIGGQLYAGTNLFRRVRKALSACCCGSCDSTSWSLAQRSNTVTR